MVEGLGFRVQPMFPVGFKQWLCSCRSASGGLVQELDVAVLGLHRREYSTLTLVSQFRLHIESLGEGTGLLLGFGVSGLGFRVAGCGLMQRIVGPCNQGSRSAFRMQRSWGRLAGVGFWVLGFSLLFCCCCFGGFAVWSLRF